ncbi:unnamed protein product [Effrenium voratum]|uniref:Uncharacterized protein n=1 Tax=Effrenium voratum TaxID=2562239 RepID=A0AA36JJH8_9DINO|nr:unnamed protein product [Effrenium voratum]CAJ1412273.1 unnamed protein product [Effrenium voratum]
MAMAWRLLGLAWTAQSSEGEGCSAEGVVPEAFSCNGSHFDSSWAKLLAASGKELQLRSQGMVNRWVEIWQDAYPAFDRLLPHGDVSLITGLNASSRDELLVQLNGFCLYGLVTALYVMASTEMAETTNEEVLELGHYALDRAWLLMGTELQYEFLSSSGWPISSLQIAALRLNLPHGTLQNLRDLSQEVYQEYWRPVATDPAQLGSSLVLGLFGWHASLLTEIAWSLERFLGVELKKLFYGAYYPEPMLEKLQEVAEEGFMAKPIAKFYRTWITGFLDTYDAWVNDNSVKEGLGILADLYLQALGQQNFDATICVTPLWFCAPLAAVLGRGSRLLVYFDDLPDQLPPQDFRTVGSWLRQTAGLYLPEASLDGESSVALLAPSALVAALTERLLGLRPPVAPWSCYYLEARRWDAPEARDVLMLRADLWVESTPGKMFVSALRLFIAEAGHPFNMTITSRKHFDWDSLWDLATRSRAGLFVPDDMMKMMFWEACAIAMPLWTPGQEFLARLLPFFGYYHFLSKHLPPQVAEAADAWGRPFPSEPFGLSDAQEKMQAHVASLFWAGMTDFVRYEAVQRFHSLPALVSAVGSCDLRALSRAMARAHEARAATARKAWRQAFQVLVR